MKQPKKWQNKIAEHFREADYYLFETFILLRLIAFSISGIAISVLIQDRICSYDFGGDTMYCQRLHQDHDGDNIINNNNNSSNNIIRRNAILSAAARFNNYRHLIDFMPMMIWSLFIGSFLDTYPGATVVLLSLNTIGHIYCNSVYLALIGANYYQYQFLGSNPRSLLLANAYVWFTGGAITLSATAYRHISLRSSPRYRALKFVIIEIVIVFAMSIAIFAGGHLLTPDVSSSPSSKKEPPTISSSPNVVDEIIGPEPNLAAELLAAPLRTYAANFYYALAFDTIALLCLFAFDSVAKIREKFGKKNSEIVLRKIRPRIVSAAATAKTIALNSDSEKSHRKEHSEVARSKFRSATIATVDQFSNENKIDNNNNNNTDNQNNHKDVEKKNMVKILFNFDNIKQTWRCFVCQRDDYARLRLHLLFGVLFAYVFVHTGLHDSTRLQFVERLYGWNVRHYSAIVAVSHAISTLVLAISSPILLSSSMLSFDEDDLIMLALLSTATANLCIGTFRTAAAYYASIPIQSFAGYAVICVRTRLSKTIPTGEIGKIFALSCAMEAAIPLFSSITFSYLFAATIDTYPAMIYHFATVVTIAAMTVMVIEAFVCPPLRSSSTNNATANKPGGESNQKLENKNNGKKLPQIKSQNHAATL